MAVNYDHDHDAEWAGKIAASVFCFPEYLKRIAEDKELPYTIQSTTDCEDYAVHREEVYRGGWGQLTTYLSPQFCLGSSERPYVDGGQTESCIAYWQRQPVVQGFKDFRPLYFRYIANQRLPAQENMYHNWYGGVDRAYSANLLHQDGRMHVLQYASKAIILAQPLKRENGHLHSLRFDALLPVYTDLDEIWVGDQQVDRLPWTGSWELPVLIRDQDIFLAFQPLKPTQLGPEEPALEITRANDHLIVSVYNLRSERHLRFPGQVLDNTHNGLIFEIGTSSEYGSWGAFRDHIRQARFTEQILLGEIRQIHYQSGPDELRLEYLPATQTTRLRWINGMQVQVEGFRSPDTIQNASGRLSVRNTTLQVEPGVIAWLACDPASEWTTACLPTDQPSPVRLATNRWSLETPAFAAGKIQIHTGEMMAIEIETAEKPAPFRISGSRQIHQARINGQIVEPTTLGEKFTWELS